ncbi:MAG: hypothetical protein KGK03_09740 [Candidatus Omnitrophica bacterium]|nr:hypothetical protein [Candidatus Omnitrophota bacterium]MDE2223334.1 hypothetical protein [Candidatus Omnitrophota bacterium]
MRPEEITVIVRLVEPFFWLAQACIIVSLLNSKLIFDFNVKIINWLLKYQGFSAQVRAEDKALKIWRRDLWILFFLNPLIIVLIHLV